MYALYAFARLADDWSDSPTAATMESGDFSSSVDPWRQWVRELYLVGATTPKVTIDALSAIRPALADAVQTFSIPGEALERLLDGIEYDRRPPVRIDTWSNLVRYCRSVASSVGEGCLAIWLDEPMERIGPEVKTAADACGLAFQLTNILRDIVEDSHRDRCYLAADDLARFGLTSEDWIAECRQRVASRAGRKQLPAPNGTDPYRTIVDLYLQRALGYYDVAWGLYPHLSLEGRRMFSLMWSTYYSLITAIAENPAVVFDGRVRVSRSTKLVLLAKHLWTPLYHRHTSLVTKGQRFDLKAFASLAPDRAMLESNESRSLSDAKIAVIGGGLAGCNAAIHLARHGGKVTLVEARMRLGGRVGSFLDKASGQQIDYCQHVGMKCCSALRRWIELTHQQDAWTEQSSLHFVSSRRKPLTIRAWPFPAPFHLSGLLLRWPDLRLRDRCVISWALVKLLLRSPKETDDREGALPWLIRSGQTERAIKNFWETILVSALGEQVDRVSLGATRKVLIDGFASTRDAFHLLVPNQPLSQLVDDRMRHALLPLGVEICDQTAVQRLAQDSDGKWSLKTQDRVLESFDGVVIAVPWNRLRALLPEAVEARGNLSSMESSPITGIHTWWDRAWLKTPHAILVRKFCQWIFPGPDAHNQVASSKTKSEGGGLAGSEAYYQVVISASRQLPRGDSSHVLELVRQEIQSLFPDARHATLLRGKVVTDPNAVFSVSPEIADARWSSDRYGEKAIFLAGDWTDTGWPATMEGALRSGVRAAEEFALRWGVPMKLENDS
ncbi:15-cis-phytoene desaturase [Pirellula sp. SH-Sr6A]|nr:15-cis-phytoene desaturase [Pirellula sp. SH-Sr6A]